MVDSPNEIRHKSFTVVRRGFDRAAVRAFLDSAATAFEAGHRIDNLLGLRRQAPFPTARRGFDQDEVRQYLTQLTRGFQQAPIDDVVGQTPSALADRDIERPAESSWGLDDRCESATPTAASAVGHREAPIAEAEPATTPPPIDATSTPVAGSISGSPPWPVVPHEPERTSGSSFPAVEVVASDGDPVHSEGDGDLAGIAEQVVASGAADISTFLQQSHAQVSRMRAEAEAKIRRAIEANDQEMQARHDRETQQLKLLRSQAEEEMQESLRAAEVHGQQVRQQASRALAETRAEADRSAEQRRASADVEADRLVCEADIRARSMIETADEESRAVRADADAFADRIRSETTPHVRGPTEAASDAAAELRAEAGTLRQQAADTLTEAQRTVADIRQDSLEDARHILADTHMAAISRSRDVMEEAYSLVVALGEVESDVETRLAEVRRMLDDVKESAFTSSVPRADLAAHIAALRNRAVER